MNFCAGRRMAAGSTTRPIATKTSPSSASRSTMASIKRMTHHAASDVFVEPSPDGKWLAVQAMADGQNHVIYLVPTDGGPEIKLGAEHGLLDAEMPDWSPDSRKIAFVSADKGMSDVAIYDLATRALEWLTHRRLRILLSRCGRRRPIGCCTSPAATPISIWCCTISSAARKSCASCRASTIRRVSRPMAHRWSSRTAARRIRRISGRCAWPIGRPPN